MTVLLLINATSFTIAGSYGCSCFFGFENVNGTCTAITQCSANLTLDCVNAECYVDSGIAKCECKPGRIEISLSLRHVYYVTKPCSGYKQLNSTHCEDVNECDTNVCSSNSDCTNIQGSYECSCQQYYVDESGSDDKTVVSCVRKSALLIGLESYMHLKACAMSDI